MLMTTSCGNVKLEDVDAQSCIKYCVGGTEGPQVAQLNEDEFFLVTGMPLKTSKNNFTVRSFIDNVCG